jgi:DNA-binding NarL/FixJ family response regulator
MKARVLVADDHALLRAGLVKLMETMDGIEVVGQASDGEEVLTAALHCAPDMVLLDIAMPKISGLDVCAQLTKSHGGVRVLMLSMHKEQQYVRKALQNGASGYLLKDAAPDELEVAIRTVMSGHTYLSPALAQGMVTDMVGTLQGNAGSADNTSLTPRQLEVLKLAAEGMSTKEIAIKLDLSVKTVDTHRTNLMNQLGIHDLAGLVRYAIRNGIVSASA